MRTGVANLPLHGGSAPRWLFERMKLLAREISIFVVSEYGADHLLKRLSHPVWFQSLGCVLGFDWHSSGVTTTTCAALKEGIQGLEADLGLYICGGKGGASRKTPDEILSYSQTLNLKPQTLTYASKTSAKVDNSALQDGYQLYHHSFFFTRSGKWAVVQQGMNVHTRYARRYHWFSDAVRDFVNEPHAAVACDQKGKPLNLVASRSQDSRTAIAQIVKEHPDKLTRIWQKFVILAMPPRHEIYVTDLNPKYFSKALYWINESEVRDFEGVLTTQGVGPKTLRALTLLAELLTGAQPSYEDPVRYSFTHGGKDGIPYPVDRTTYDQSIEILRSAIRNAKISPYEKDRAYRRLEGRKN